MIEMGTTSRANVAVYRTLFLSRCFAPKLITNGVVVSSYLSEKAKSGPLRSSLSLGSRSLSFSLFVVHQIAFRGTCVIFREASYECASVVRDFIRGSSSLCHRCFSLSFLPSPFPSSTAKLLLKFLACLQADEISSVAVAR